MVSLEDIKREIDKETEKLSVPYLLENEYYICKDYTKNNKMFKLEDLLDIDIWEFIKCYSYVISDKKINMEECIRFSESLKAIFEELSYHGFKIIMETILLASEKKENNILITGIGEEAKTHINDFKYVISFVHDNHLVASKSFAFLKVFKKLKYDLDSIDRILKDSNHNSSSIRKKAVKKVLNDYYSEEDIIARHNSIVAFVLNEEKKNKEINKANHKAIIGYSKGYSLLEQESKNEEIKRVEQIIKYIKSDSIKRMILEYIMNHNKKYYDRLNDELNELSSNSINLYQGVLSKYHIHINSKYIKGLLHVSLKDIDYMLSILSRVGFSEAELLYILKYSNTQIVEQIKKFIDLGYLSLSFLRKNINFFSVDSGDFKRYEESLVLLNQFGINPQLFKDNPMILLSNYELLKKNILLIDEYECIKSLKSTTSFDFLLDHELAFKLDKMIELGYYDYLSEDIGILNRDKKRFLRFELLNKMNMPITDKEEFMEIIDSNKFIVEDDKIEEYLLDVSKYHDNNDFFTMNNIMTNKINNLTISLNGQLISYPKFKRKINEGYSIKDAVCFGKYLSEEEYSIFVNEIGNIY